MTHRCLQKNMTETWSSSSVLGQTVLYEFKGLYVSVQPVLLFMGSSTDLWVKHWCSQTCLCFYCSRGVYLVFFILPSVGEAGDDGGDAGGRGDLAGVDHYKKLHQVVVNFPAAALHDVHVLAAHAFSDLHAEHRKSWLDKPDKRLNKRLKTEQEDVKGNTSGETLMLLK